MVLRTVLCTSTCILYNFPTITPFQCFSLINYIYFYLSFVNYSFGDSLPMCLVYLIACVYVAFFLFLSTSANIVVSRSVLVDSSRVQRKYLVLVNQAWQRVWASSQRERAPAASPEHLPLFNKIFQNFLHNFSDFYTLFITKIY